MILRSIAIGLVATLIYAITVSVFASRVPRAAPTQHQANIVRLELIWHAKQPPQNVLVGTSLAARLSPTLLRGRIGNAAQSASGPMTGLAFVESMKRLPQRVFVEVNMLHQPVDQATVDYFRREPASTLREILPFLRQSEQPVNVATSWLNSRRPEPVDRVRPERLAMALEFLSSQNQQVRSEAALERELNELCGALKRIKQRGCEVVLVEFPLHPAVKSAPRYRQTFDALARAFPERNWRWIRPNASEIYETVDGLHLTSDAAARFSSYLLEQSGLSVASSTSR